MSATNHFHDAPADDAFGLYLRQAVQTPLLSREEETSLGRAIRAWRDSDDPSEDVVRNGKQALDMLVNANLRLVVHIARRYAYASRPLNDIADLVQEGNIALIGAAEDFNPEMGHRFSTYAVYRIRQAISRALQTTDVPVPVHIKERLMRLSRLLSEYHSANGRDPSVAELAAMMKLRESDVQHLLRIRSLTVTSLSHPVYDGDRCIEDVVADDHAPGSPADIDRRESEIDVRDLLSVLPLRDRMIVQRWFGIDGEKESLASIARSCNISRERVRQIIAASLSRMREMLNHRTRAAASYAPCQERATPCEQPTEDDEPMENVVSVHRSR